MLVPFNYAGVAQPEWAYGASPWDRYGEPSSMPGRNRIAVDGHVPLCKLHGSLNWEPAGRSVRIYRDMRLPFRRGGSAAIVAPTPEKRPPAWLADVWDHAYRILSGSDRWAVVGYSLPSYDHAVRRLCPGGGTAPDRKRKHRVLRPGDGRGDRVPAPQGQRQRPAG